MCYKTEIARYVKLLPYIFVSFAIVSLGAIALLNMPAITKLMGYWQLLPRQQCFTELYFSDIYKIPNSAARGAEQNVAFTVHNLEHAQTTYRYTIVAVTSDNRAAQVLGANDISLDNNESKNINHIIAVPSFDDSRAGIRVEIEYQGIALGNTTPSLERQSIQYWVKVT